MDNNKYVLSIESNDIRFQQDVDMSGWKVSLEKLSYDKGIYRPAEIMVTLNVGGTGLNVDKLTDAFHQKIAKLSVDGKTVAEDYFVFKVRPVFRTASNGSSVKLELTICSRDKLITLDKYSKAWTGRKLGEYVFDEEVKGLPFNLSTCRDLQVVSFDGGEFIQPYLVQYNESFYDFMRRTANRCGEFLYHEDGKLHLGMTMNDKATDNDPDYARLASERYYETITSEGLETHDYTYDYLKDRPEPEDRPYSNPLTYDDYLSDVDPDYTSFDEQKDFESRNIVLALSLCLEGTSLAKILANMATTSAFKIGKAFVVEKNLDDKYKEVNRDPWKEKTEQMNGDKLRQFGTAQNHKTKCGLGDKKVNMNGAFYALVREAEKKVGENAVYLEFGQNTQDLRIGDKIKVDGTPYVVIGVKGACDLVYKSDKTTERVEPTYEESQKVIGVKLYGDAPIPPALPNTVIRESQPQLAFVAANMDPMKIGRVRLRFAWQRNKDDENDENKKAGDVSPWVRVSLPFATDAGGVKFKPEKNDEVMVSFEEGNIERPYVSGFLLSPRSNESWSYLPDRGITSKNGHNITFNDGIDGASFYYSLSPMLKLVRTYLPNFIFPQAMTDDMNHRSLTGGMTLSDRYGMYRINMSSDMRSVAIQSAMGEVTLSAFTGITISAPNGDVKIVGKNVSIQAGDTVTIESGQNVKERFFSDDGAYEEEGLKWYQRGGKTIGEAWTNFWKGGVNRTINKLVDVQLIRTVLDVALRPIDGTTKIKSYTFVRMEAGKGSAEYPKTALKSNSEEMAAYDLVPTIKKIAEIAGSRVESIKTAYEKMCEDIEAFNNISGNEGINPNEAVISVDYIKNRGDAELDFNWNAINMDGVKREIEQLKQQYDDDVKNAQQEKPKVSDDKYQQYEGVAGLIFFQEDMKSWEQKMAQLQTNYQGVLADQQGKVNNTISEVQNKANKLKKSILKFMESKQNFNSANNQLENSIFNADINDALGKMAFLQIEQITKNTKKEDVTNWDNLKKHYMRTAVYNLLTCKNVKDLVSAGVKIKSSTKTKENLDGDNWAALVNDFVAKPESGFKDWVFDTYWDPIKDPFVNRKRWKVGLQGKILLSENSDQTMSFKPDGTVKLNQNAMFTNKTADNLKELLKNIGA